MRGLQDTHLDVGVRTRDGEVLGPRLGPGGVGFGVNLSEDLAALLGPEFGDERRCGDCQGERLRAGLETTGVVDVADIDLLLSSDGLFNWISALG